VCAWQQPDDWQQLDEQQVAQRCGAQQRRQRRAAQQPVPKIASATMIK
jgi:hypothetical protein